MNKNLLPIANRYLATMRSLLLYLLVVLSTTIFVFFTGYTSRAENSCTTTQLSNTIGNTSFEYPSIDGTGNLILLESNLNLDNDNADLSEELFLYNVTTDSFTQITDSLLSQNRRPELSSDGTRLAFMSTGNYDILNTNGEGNLEMFLYDIATDNFTQVTDTPMGLTESTSLFPRLNSNGNFIAYSDRLDPNGTNMDGNPEAFLYDVALDSFTQITDIVTVFVNNFHIPFINGDGTKVVFSSRENLVTTNPDNSVEVFLYDSTTDTITQVTDFTGLINGVLGFSGDGSSIIIVSNGNFTNENPSGFFQIFHLDIISGTYTQLTDGTGSVFPPNVSLNSDGTLIVFDLIQDFAGQNPDGNREIFLYNLTDNSWTQLTDTIAPRNNQQPSINADGSKIAFLSSGDLTGENADHNLELFLTADCISSDSDGDGVDDGSDLCQDSNTDTTVIIDGCDSGISNFIDGDGCSISDLIAEIATTASNHGNFVSQVSHLLNELKSAGIISGRDKGAIQSCAGGATIP